MTSRLSISRRSVRIATHSVVERGFQLHRHWPRREVLLFAVFGGFGLLILPGIVYLVGQRLLGEYRPDAGMGGFYADLYGHLGTLSVWAWLLVLGPWIAVQTLRLLWLPLEGLMRRDSPEDRDEDGGGHPGAAI